MNKRCTNCGRFPFCKFQLQCLHFINRTWNADGDYWIKHQNKEIKKNR